MSQLMLISLSLQFIQIVTFLLIDQKASDCRINPNISSEQYNSSFLNSDKSIVNINI